MEINWKELKIQTVGEKDLLKEIVEHLSYLYQTAVGSIPLDREFGIDQSFLSYPLPIAENMCSVEMIEKTERYEPRVLVESVSFEEAEGKLIPVIQISLTEGSESKSEP